ncbi:MAG: YkgJ family cysteine cluster protein [Spirochaetales bacterium]|nr:YkgJ family cysteine cluster protein [Spirochaetales bacterium]
MIDDFTNIGLRFECTQCSHCCRHDPGYVFMSQNDIDRICAYLKIEEKTFIDTYCKIISFNNIYKISLIEKPNFDCIFWETKGCSIYPVRPLQCQSYPFWRHNIESREKWKEVAKECPGIGRGRFHSLDEIESWIRRMDAEDFVFEDEETS